jgi:hypothetical protein
VTAMFSVPLRVAMSLGTDRRDEVRLGWAQDSSEVPRRQQHRLSSRRELRGRSSTISQAAVLKIIVSDTDGPSGQHVVEDTRRNVVSSSWGRGISKRRRGTHRRCPRTSSGPPG